MHGLSLDKPLFELVEGEGEKERITPLFSVMDILETVIGIGKRGVEITRFKGLGEMDAKAKAFKAENDKEYYRQQMDNARTTSNRLLHA